MIDLHTHTTYSDGSFTPEEVLEEAEKKEVTILSITDHNTIDAYKELTNKKVRNKFLGIIISGVEITTTYKGETIEVLGYDFDLEKMKEILKQNVLTFEQKQRKEYDLIKERYQKIGIIFKEENINYNPKIESSRGAFLEEIKKYKENDSFFLNSTSKESVNRFTREEIYNPNSPLYVDESSLFPTLEKVIEMIHQASGKAFLAHTYAYSKNIPNQLLNILDKYSFDGLECFYTTFTEEQTNYLVNLCKERGLYMSGGSDFHGTRKENHNLATGKGNLEIKEEIITPWFHKKEGII